MHSAVIPPPAGSPAGRRGLSIAAAAVAASAWLGAAGLAAGFLALPERLARRLPFASPVVAGLALALVVALPYTTMAWLAWRGGCGVTGGALACGVVLMVWIAVELAFVRELSFLHPLLAAVGAAFAYAGRAAPSDLRAMRHEQVRS